MGSKALSAVMKGMKADNPEIAKRCSDLLPALRRSDWKQVREGVARSTTSFEHPVWTKLKAAVGDDEDARAFDGGSTLR